MLGDAVRLIRTAIHGRVLVRDARVDPEAAQSRVKPRGVLVGFHGYREHAGIQMARLRAIPGADNWALVSVQALHRFYRGRSEEVVASWMTREDRDAMIADNVEYVDAAVASVVRDPDAPLVWAGFSQGVAMAFRAAVLGRHGAAGVIAVGGDIPPELLGEPVARLPRVLLARGADDEWYTQARLEADGAALTAGGVRHQALTCAGAHEWSDAVSAAAGHFLAELSGPTDRDPTRISRA